MNALSEAYGYFSEALAISPPINAEPLTLEILPGVAHLFYKQGYPTQAIYLLRLSLEHPACYSEVSSQAQPLLDRLRREIAPARYDQAGAQDANPTRDEALAMISNHQDR